MTVVDQVDAPPAEGPSTPFRGPNKEKARARSRRYQQRNRERLNAENRARRHGLTPAEMELRLRGMRCEICGSDRNPALDRAGILCTRCAMAVKAIRTMPDEAWEHLGDYLNR